MELAVLVDHFGQAADLALDPDVDSRDEPGHDDLMVCAYSAL
jgi:hypothetical protein